MRLACSELPLFVITWCACAITVTPCKWQFFIAANMMDEDAFVRELFLRRAMVGRINVDGL